MRQADSTRPELDLETLRAAAHDLPEHQPSPAQREALRASLLEAARVERTASGRRGFARRAGAGRGRRVTGAVLAVAGAAALAAGLVLWWSGPGAGGDAQSGAGEPSSAGGQSSAGAQSSAGEHSRPVAQSSAGEHSRPVAQSSAAAPDRGGAAPPGSMAPQPGGDLPAGGAAGARAAAIQSSPDADFDHRRRRVAGPSGPVTEDVVRLRQGRLAVTAPARRPGQRFSVVTGDSELDVHSTSFEVVVAADHLQHVMVRTGSVWVRPAGRAPVEVRAGQSWTRPPAAPARRETRVAPATSGPLAATESRGPEPTPPAPATSPTPGELAFGRGFGALQRADYSEAASELALSISSDPGGPLADDARYWRGVALARAGRSAAARTALADFLARAPHHARASSASVMLGWLLVDAGEPAAARPHFRAALADPDHRIRASAAKGLRSTE